MTQNLTLRKNIINNIVKLIYCYAHCLKTTKNNFILMNDDDTIYLTFISIILQNHFMLIIFEIVRQFED